MRMAPTLAHRSFGFVVLVAIAAGCGGTQSVPWEAPFSGRRSYNVTAELVSNPSATTTTTTFSRFTMVFDADRQIAIVGANRSSATTHLQRTSDGAFRFVDRVSVQLAAASSIVSIGCPEPSVTYDEFVFTIDAAGGLTGRARSDNGQGTVTGIPDTTGPILGQYQEGDDDPFVSFRIISTEPLPAPPVFRSDSGEVLELIPSPQDPFLEFVKPPIMLPYGQRYDVDGIADFAGNPATVEGALGYYTGTPPPLVAADGFESLADTLQHGAVVLSNAGEPIISGARSVLVWPITGTPANFSLQLALRLAIAPGDTVLRFSYRTVSRTPNDGYYAAQYMIGSVGGTIVTATLPDGATETPATVSGVALMLGPTMEAKIDLPKDAAGEILFARENLGAGHCLVNQPPGPAGIIIDDLRTE